MTRILVAQRRVPMLTALAMLFVVWEVVGRADVSMAIPPVTQIAGTFPELVSDPDFAASVAQSAAWFAYGFGLSMLVGVGLGLAMGLSRAVDAAFGFYVNVFMGAPIAAFVPLLVAIFGVGGGSIVSTVFVFSVFVIIVNVSSGVKAVPARLIEMSHSFGASRSQRIRRIVMPSAMPLILTGIKVGFGRGIAGLVLGEMLVAIVGIGGMIMQRGSTFQVAHLWGLIFMVAAVAVAGTRLIEYVQRRTTAWASSQA